MQNHYLTTSSLTTYSRAIGWLIVLLVAVLPTVAQAQCSIVLKSTVSGCYSTTAGSRATVSVEVAWVNEPASSTISVTLGGQTRIIDPGTLTLVYTPSTSGQQVIVTPQVVAFELPADGTSKTIQAFFGSSYASATCKNQITVNLPVACAPTPCVAGQIGGQVFNDFDANGVKNTTESTVGQAGVTVKAFDCLGNLVETATTDVTGHYSFTSLTAAKYPIRVEFSNIPTLLGQGTVNGTDGRTTTQFVAASDCNVDLGVLNPNDYCQATPQIVISCFTYGDPLPGGSASGLVDALVSFDYGTSGPKDMTKITTLALAKTTGTTWGVAYDKYRKKIYTSATVKRHAGLGPLGLGGIYVTDMASGTTASFINVTTLGINVGSSSAGNPWFGVTNSTRGLTTNPSASSTDPKSFSLIGKIGIGDIDVSEDGNSLFFVNLFDKKLYQLNITGATPTLTASYAIPDPGCTDGNFRPFAMKVYRGSVYVGSVCDASGALNNKSNLRAYVHKFTGSSFATTPVFDFPLTYPKGYVANQKPSIVGWYPWTDDFADLITNSVADGNAYRLVYPQPIFTGIAFDIDGSMVLSFGDRTGLQTGFKNKSVTDAETTTIKLYDGNSGGDILRAAFTNGAYILENNAKIPGISGAGVNNNQGPGFGEFYNDNLAFAISPSLDISHAEIAFGGLGLMPGSGQIVIGSMDPINIYQGGSFNAGGVRYLDNTTGQSPTGTAQGFILYGSSGASADPGTFAKATGLGDIAIACDLPTYLQIGNRVWSDVNKDGVQDPCEPPLVGVNVALYKAGVLIATTTTNTNGEYYFTYTPVSSTVSGSTTALTPNTAYQVVFGTSGQFANNLLTNGGTTYVLTKTNSSTTNANDQNDSDAAIATVAGITAPVISLTTGAAGSVNHTYDVGFVQTARLGDYVFEDKNANGTQDAGDVPIQGVVVTLITSGSVVATTTTNASGLYSFTNLTPGTPYSVSFTAPAGFTATLTNVGSDTADSDGNAAGLTGTYSLTAGENNPTIDMGYYKPASLGDFVFFDADKSGTQNVGDVPIPGVVVTLYLNGNAIATTTTNGSGLYSFTGLTPGTSNSYVVGFTTPSGYTATTTNTGSNSAIDSDLIAATGRTISYTLSSGQNNTSIDAGFICKLPSVTAVASSASVCLGTPVTLTAQLSAAGSYTYVWTAPVGVTLTGGSTATAIATGLSSGTNTFTVTVSSPPLCSTFATVSVVVNPAPVASLSASSATICAGSSTTLTASGGTSYSFSTGLVNTTGILVASPTSTTVYSVTVASASGCSSSTSLSITVNQLPIATLSSATICAGGTTLLNATGGTSYTLTPGNVFNTSGLFTLTPSGTTTYTVTAANATGCKATTTGTVTVNAPPSPTLTSASICAGQTANLTASGGSSYTLNPGNVVNTTGLFALAPTGTTTYTVTTSNTSGCIATATGTVTVNTQPTVTVLNTSCNGSTTYTVNFSATAGATITASAGTVSGSQVLNVPSGTSLTITATLGSCNATASVTRNCASNVASLGDYAFIDSNANGIQDSGDLPLPGVLVTLISNGTVVATTTTNSSGLYSFTGLTPGQPYSVSFAAPAGFKPTAQQAAGSTDTNDSDASPITGQTRSVTLAPGDNNPNLDAGFYKPASLGNYVFEDKNRNGIQDAGDTPIAGVVVTLVSNGTVVATTTTNAAGLYSFTGLTPGKPYAVSFTTPATYSATAPLSGTDTTLDSNPVGGITAPVTLTSGENNTTLDAGFYTCPVVNVLLSGSVTICAGQAVTLTASGASTYVFSAAGASGNTLIVQPLVTTPYSVTGLDGFGCPGSASATVTVNPQPTVLVLNTSCNGSTTYTVNFSATAGATITASAGTVSGSQVLNVPSGTSLTITATLGSCNATASVTRDCASNVASLGNYAFIDSNANGIQDGGDLPLPGVLVKLLSNGSVLATTTTDGSGLYSFTGLTPGVPYSVSFTAPAGYSATGQQAAGSTDATDSDASVATGQTRSVTLAAGENNPNLDAGFVKQLPTYAIAKTVNLKQVEKGQIVTYTLSLTNTSTITATSLVLTDQLSSLATTFVGSATTTAGTFAPGSNNGTWSIGSLAGGQVATLSFRVQLNEEGITYNTVTAPDGQTASVCTTVPFHVCANEAFEFLLVVPNSYSTYQWSRNGQPIAGATTNTLSATAAGEYTVTGNGQGGCPNGSCCPFIIVADPVPSLTALAVSAPCVGVTPQNNAAITLTGANALAVSYNITKGSSFSAAAPLFSSPQALSAVMGGVLLGGQPNPALAQEYTVRVYSAGGCFADTVVSIQPAVCNCPPATCAPIVIKKTKAQGKSI